MAKTIKILSLGLSQSNFLSQLYGDLQNKYENYKVGVDKYHDISKGQIINKKEVFNEYFDFEKEIVTRFQSIRSFIQRSFTKEFWEIYFFERSQGRSIKETYYFLRSYAYDKVIVEQYILNADYNIYHFHYCTPERLKYIHHFPENKKIICSFWGSDLMRETGIRNVFYVKKALEKADIITIQNAELAEMLYCKYGREFKDKTKLIQFTIHTEVYNYIDAMRDDMERINFFKSYYKIPYHKKVIVVSHNASAANNHFKILQSLEILPAEIVSKILVLIPLGYGRNENYIKSLESYKKSSTLQIVMLHQFLGPEETALLRICTDIMIQMPISDALSGAMTEVLYAGKQVYVGSWLPYGLLRRNGVSFTEIESFSDIIKVVRNYFQDESYIRSKNSYNAKKIKTFLFPDKTTFDWNEIYEKLL